MENCYRKNLIAKNCSALLCAELLISFLQLNPSIKRKFYSRTMLKIKPVCRIAWKTFNKLLTILRVIKFSNSFFCRVRFNYCTNNIIFCCQRCIPTFFRNFSGNANLICSHIFHPPSCLLYNNTFLLLCTMHP